MDKYIIERIKEEASQILLTKMTIREIAKLYGISKSTVHKDITENLKEINPILHSQVQEVLNINKKERHLRGGEATRKKYLNQSNYRVIS